jgi:hypothetical protein
MRLLRTLSAISAIVSLGLCSAYAGVSELAVPTQNLLGHTYHCPKFNKIVADGYFNIKIVHQNSAPSIKTFSYESAPIDVAIQGHTLFLASDSAYYPSYSQHPQVIVRIPNRIHLLRISGPVNVTANKSTSSNLTVLANGYGHIRLNHAGNVHRIVEEGNSVINANGVNTNLLSVKIDGASTMALRGHVNHFYARLYDDATLRARHLVAKHIVIQAKYNSAATIYPVKSLRAFTDQTGEIYYYKQLTNLTRYSIDSGNVLQMK